MMKDTPDHLPAFLRFIYDIIDAPLNVLSLCEKKWGIPDYDSIFHHF